MLNIHYLHADWKLTIFPKNIISMWLHNTALTVIELCDKIFHQHIRDDDNSYKEEQGMAD